MKKKKKRPWDFKKCTGLLHFTLLVTINHFHLEKETRHGDQESDHLFIIFLERAFQIIKQFSNIWGFDISKDTFVYTAHEYDVTFSTLAMKNLQ